MTTQGLFAGEGALVTGSASNIGRGIALALAREGAHVVLVDVDMERNAAVAREIGTAGGSAETLSADLSQPQGWKDVIQAVEGRLPQMFVHAACPRRLAPRTAMSCATRSTPASPIRAMSSSHTSGVHCSGL